LNNQEVFNEKAKFWNSTRDLPWNQLRYEVTYELITRHFSNKRIRLLEIGCGNGYEGSLWRNVADEITLSDSSEEMLDMAKSLFESFGSQVKVNFIRANAKDIAEDVSGEFDLILFHNVIEYVQEPIAALKSIKGLLSSEGMLSLRHLNRYSNPFIPAMFENDLDTTISYLKSSRMKTSYGTEIDTFTKTQVNEYLQGAGFEIEKFYGVLALTGYMTDNERKFDPAFYNQLKEIELDMAGTFPYCDIARSGLFFAKHKPNEA